MGIVPIKGKFEDWRTMLARIMEDDTVKGFIIVTLHEDETMCPSHFDTTREQHAFAALLLQRAALLEE